MIFCLQLKTYSQNLKATAALLPAFSFQLTARQTEFAHG